MDLSKSISDLQQHLSKCNDDKYSSSVIDTEGIIFSLHGKGFNIGNATKYLSRYMTEGFEKSGTQEDLLKACHYILMEYERINRLSKNEE